MDGGHKSVGTGLTDYQACARTTTRTTIRAASRSYMDPTRSELHSSVDRMGRVVDQHVNVFHIETALNNRMFDGPMAFLGKNEDGFSDFDRSKLEGLRWTLGKLPRALRQAKIFQKIPAAYGLIACVRRRDRAGARKDARDLLAEQYAVTVKGQADILIAGMPYISPYNVNSILNPMLVQVMGLRVLLQHVPRQAAGEEGRHADHLHPCTTSSIPSITRATSSSSTGSCRRPPTRWSCTASTRRSSRRTRPTSTCTGKGNAYHGAHPFYMWYWGETGRQHLGQDHRRRRREHARAGSCSAGSAPTRSTEAIDMARGRQGRSASITLMHHPPMVMTDVALTADEGAKLLPEQGGASAAKPTVAAKEHP